MTYSTDVQRSILEYAETVGLLLWRNNTGRTKGKSGGWMWVGKKGSGDLVGCLPDGRFLSVEIKSLSDDLSDDQIRFMDEVSSSNGQYWVVFTLEGFINRLNRYLDDTLEKKLCDIQKRDLSSLTSRRT